MPVTLSDAAIRYACRGILAAPAPTTSEDLAAHAEVFAALHRLLRRQEANTPDPVTVRSIIVMQGHEKIVAIKALRAATHMGLKEAKDVIEGSAPRITRTFDSIAEARAFIDTYPEAFEVAP